MRTILSWFLLVLVLACGSARILATACMLQQPAGFRRTDEDFVTRGQSPRDRNDVRVVTASTTVVEVGQ